RGAAVIERSVTAEGPLTRAQLAERIAAAGVRTEGQAIVHLLALASLRGRVLRGPLAGREHAYALVRDWLGAPPAQHAAFDRDRALAELAVRYLAGHGPASGRAVGTWGLPGGKVAFAPFAPLGDADAAALAADAAKVERFLSPG